VAHQPPQAQVVADFLLPLSYTLKNTESTNMHQSKQNQQKSSQHQHQYGSLVNVRTHLLNGLLVNW
jgi:hypothetical protein